jgi:hypothetical protein
MESGFVITQFWLPKVHHQVLEESQVKCIADVIVLDCFMLWQLVFKNLHLKWVYRILCTVCGMFLIFACLLDFLRLQTIVVWTLLILASVTDFLMGLFLISCSELHQATYATCRWTLSWVVPYHTRYTPSLLHLYHRSMIPEHTLSFPHLRHNFW